MTPSPHEAVHLAPAVAAAAPSIASVPIDGWTATGIAAVGACALKVVERLIPSQRERTDDQSRFRSDLMGTISRMQDRISQMERSSEELRRTHDAEIASIRTKYDLIRVHYIQLVSLYSQLRARHERLQEDTDELKLKANIPLSPWPPIPAPPIIIDEVNIEMVSVTQTTHTQAQAQDTTVSRPATSATPGPIQTTITHSESQEIHAKE